MAASDKIPVVLLQGTNYRLVTWGGDGWSLENRRLDAMHNESWFTVTAPIHYDWITLIKEADALRCN